MKKNLKIVYILLIVLSILVGFSEVHASTVTEHTLGEIVSGGEEFIGKANTVSPIKTPNLKTLSNTIYNILLAVGIIAAFIVGGILGIKYMTGGIEGQVEVKTMLVPYIIGCVVLFGAFTIWKIVVLILQ